MRRILLNPEGKIWHSLWFEAGSARNLAAARIVFALQALWVLLSRDLPALSALPDPFWAQVPASLRWRYLIFPDHPARETFLWAAAVICLIAALLGLWPRVTCLASGLLLYHLSPLQALFWTPSPYERGFTIALLGLITLSFSPCADVWRVGGSRRPVAPGWEYAWALRLLQLYVAEVYLFSGYAKLIRAGWKWVSAENLQKWFLVFSEQDQIAVFHSFGLWLARHPSVCLAIAVAALAFDFAFVGAVFSRRARRILVPLALLFHAGIVLTLNIVYLNVAHLLIFINWEWLAGKLGHYRRHHREYRVPAPAAGG